MAQPFPSPKTFPLDQVAELHDDVWIRTTDEPIGVVRGARGIKSLYGREYMPAQIDPWVKRLCAEIVALQKRVAELEGDGG